MELIEIDTRHPSINFNLKVQNEGFSVLLNQVWIEWEAFNTFIEQTSDISYKDKVSSSLESMSPGEMRITADKISPDNCKISYDISKILVHRDGFIRQHGNFEATISQLEDMRIFIMEMKLLFS